VPSNTYQFHYSSNFLRQSSHQLIHGHHYSSCFSCGFGSFMYQLNVLKRTSLITALRTSTRPNCYYFGILQHYNFQQIVQRDLEYNLSSWIIVQYLFLIVCHLLSKAQHSPKSSLSLVLCSRCSQHLTQCCKEFSDQPTNYSNYN